MSSHPHCVCAKSDEKIQSAGLIKQSFLEKQERYSGIASINRKESIERDPKTWKGFEGNSQKNDTQKGGHN